jgi:hypothetical protein
VLENSIDEKDSMQIILKALATLSKDLWAILQAYHEGIEFCLTSFNELVKSLFNNRMVHYCIV